MSKEYACTACHQLEGNGQNLAPGLDNVHLRLQADWVAHYLVDPVRWSPSGRMPAALFQRGADGGYLAAKPGRDASEDLADIVAYLFRGGHQLLNITEPTGSASAGSKWSMRWGVRAVTVRRAVRCRRGQRWRWSGAV